MSEKSNEELADLFAQAERRRTCFVPDEHRIKEALRRRIGRGEVVRPMRGVYARSSYWDSLSRYEQTRHILRGLQVLRPEWTFCHESAAVAWGLPVSHKALETVHVVAEGGRRRGRRGDVISHDVKDDLPVMMYGIRATSFNRTVYDCTRRAPFGDALAIADGALRRRGVSASRLVGYFRGIGGACVGTDRAVSVMRYADPRSESGGESIARVAMIAHGFAIPELQVEFPRPLEPRRTYRVDFLWTRLDGTCVMGEFDGMSKYEDKDQRNGRSSLRVLADEQHREAQLSVYGMPIVRLSYRDVMDEDRLIRLLELYEIPRIEELGGYAVRGKRSDVGEALLFRVFSLRRLACAAGYGG